MSAKSDARRLQQYRRMNGRERPAVRHAFRRQHWAEIEAGLRREAEAGRERRRRSKRALQGGK